MHTIKINNNVKNFSNIYNSNRLEHKKDTFNHIFKNYLKEHINNDKQRSCVKEDIRISRANNSIFNEMMNLEKISISLKIIVGVKNKIVSAYKDIMNTQL